MEENKKWFNKLGFSYFWSTIIISVVQIAAIMIISAINGEFAQKYSLLVSMLPMYIIGGPIVFKLISRQEGSHIEQNEFSFGSMVGAFFVCVAAMEIGNMVGNSISSSITQAFDVESSNVVAELLMGNELWQNIIVVVIAGPIFEELFFRKFMIDRLVKYGDKVAIVVSALAFGLFHGNIVQFVYATLLGMVFAYVYLKSGKIYLSMILHMLINFIGGVAGVLILQKSNILELSNALVENPELEEDAQALGELFTSNTSGLILYGVYLLVLLAATIIGIIVFCANAKKLNLMPGEITIEKGKAFKTIAANPGCILYIAVWLVMMVLALI